MSCTAIRHRLLASERPDRLATLEARHLAACPACRAWLGRLAHLEQQLPLLPTPVSTPPAALFAQILEGAPLNPLVAYPLSLRPSSLPRRESARQKLALSLALAASLALFALGWWAWPHTQSSAVEPARQAYLALRDQRLAPARTPQHRVAVLADLADEFLAEARTHSNDTVHLTELVWRFRWLVQNDLPRLAREVPRADRVAFLNRIATRLRNAESEAARLAAGWKYDHPGAAESLAQIAAAAHEADRRLLLLAQV